MLTVVVRYHEEDGHWWAESPTLPELSAGGSSLSEARQMVVDALDFYLEGQKFELDETIGLRGVAIDLAEPLSRTTAAVHVGVKLRGPELTFGQKGPFVSPPPASYGVDRGVTLTAAC